MTKPLHVLQLLAALFCFPALAISQINIEISPNPVLITGSQTTFDIVLSSAAGETFDAITLAFAVGDGGSATGSPQDGDNLSITGFQVGSIFNGTDFTPVVTTGGVGASAILINFNSAAGSSANIAADGVLASITLDTSSVAPSSVYVLNTNILGATDIFDDGVPLAFVAESVQLQSSSAILGDCDLNGVVNFFDIAPFISILSVGPFLEEADTNQDGAVNFSDISSFIEFLSAG